MTSFCLQITRIICRSMNVSDLWKVIVERNISPELNEVVDRFMNRLGPQGAFSTCTYGEVGPIFLGQNIAKSDILCPNKNKTMFMIFLTQYFVKLIFLGSLEAIPTSICI